MLYNHPIRSAFSFVFDLVGAAARAAVTIGLGLVVIAACDAAGMSDLRTFTYLVVVYAGLAAGVSGLGRARIMMSAAGAARSGSNGPSPGEGRGRFAVVGGTDAASGPSRG